MNNELDPQLPAEIIADPKSLSRNSRTARQLIKMTPRTQELLSEVIDGERFSYVRSKTCKVCQADEEIKNLVDTLLLYPKSYTQVLEFVRPIEIKMDVPVKKRISFYCIRDHQKNHLEMDKQLIREVVERNARKKILDTKDRLLTSEAFYEVVAHEGFQEIVKGRQKPSLNQTMYAMNKLAQLEKEEESQFRPEALLSQLNTIVQAMREVLPPEWRDKVLAKIEDIQHGLTLESQFDSYEEAEIVEEDDEYED